MASSCPEPALPFEILELVVGHLALEGDMASINSCCLANSHLVHMCRKHLFSFVVLHQDSSHGSEPHPLKRFRKRLDRCPMISNCVRTLDIATRLPAPAGQLGIGAGHRAFRHLRRVHTFRLLFMCYDATQVTEEDFSRLPNPFRHALKSFARRNEIVHLGLRCLSNVPVTFLQEFRMLEVLDLVGVDVVDDREDDDDGEPGECLEESDGQRLDSSARARSPRKRLSHHFPIPLRSLSLSCCKPFVDQHIIAKMDSPRRLFDLSYLRSLNFRCAWSMDAFCKIMKMSDRISSLRSSGCSPAYNFTDTMSLYLKSTSVQSLKVLEISPLIEDIWTDPYAGLVGELEKLASRGGQNLEELVIAVNVQTDSICTTEPEAWNVIDGALSAENVFPHLKVVKLNISLTQQYMDCSTIKQDLERIGEEGFLWLKGHVKFEFGVQVLMISRHAQ